MLAAVLSGDYCHKNMVIGMRFTTALPIGRSMGCGIGCCIILQMTLTWNTSRLTLRFCVPTHALLVLLKKHGDAEQQALGRSCGGFSTKIHGVCDALGNPLGFILTGGQVADCTQAIPLISELKFEALLADKGYDSDAIIAHVEAQGATAIIPPKRNRITPREYDKITYKERHKIECAFGFLKHYRKIFSRFDKIANRFAAFLHFVAALQWIK